MAQADEPRQGLQPELDYQDEYVPPNLCRAPAYPYRQLVDNDIRLLTILPGNGTLECSLHQMPLEKGLVFRALSYVWGNQFETEEILVEGEPFNITCNLHEALQQLRKELPGPILELGHPNDYYWIDAICLNQKDMKEKSHQVPRMMEIYQSAYVVMIWLGINRPMAKSEKLSRRDASSPADPVRFLQRGGSSADDVVGLLFEKAGSLGAGWKLPEEVSEQEPILREVFGATYGAVLQASAELLQRPWFERVWTFQECSMGESSWVFSGRHGVHFTELVSLLKVLGRHHRVLFMTPGFARIHAITLVDDLKYDIMFSNGSFKVNTAECLLELLSSSFNRRATDPRDQLYGLLSLVIYFAGEDLPIELKPDYSLPFELVYWHYTAYLIRHGGDLGLLVTERRPLEGVPSWVPDFRSLTTLKYLKREQTISVSSDKRMLHLKGLRMEPICDTVCEWYDPRLLPTTGCIHPELHHRIRYVEGRIFKLASQIRGVTLEEVLESLFQKASRLFSGGGMDGMLRAYTNLKGHSSRNGAWLPRRETVKTTDAFGKDFIIADEIRRSLVLLDDGTILSVRRVDVEMMPDDLICVFKGASYPIAIRPSGEGDSFVLVGYCDIMFGTFVRQSFDEDFWVDKQLEDFRLV